jgi:hypothetical protein
VDGTVHIEGDLDLADAIDFNTALTQDAHQQLLAGSTESLDVRRSIAAGNLARNQLTLHLETPEDPENPKTKPTKPKRQVVLHVHLEQAAVHGTGQATGPTAGGLARVQETPGPVTAEQVRTWCGNPDTTVTVQPVLDLAEHIHVNAYQASSRLKLQTFLRDHVCAFPYCYRPAEACDCEHRVPHKDDGGDETGGAGGPTCSCNQAPACRSHHRAKTTGGWTYLTVEPGVYLWRSPLGYQFLKDHHGTLDVTPDEDRRKLARRFQGHFGPSDPEP